MNQVHQLSVGGFDHNFSYLAVADNGDALIVDPTGDTEMIRAALKEAGEVTPRYILLTHGHLDHTQSLGEIAREFPGRVAAHPRSQETSQVRLRDELELPFGDGFVKVWFTPGHSPDSVCYEWPEGNALFTGDVLFIGCIGFCRSKEMFQSLREKILPLAEERIVYPGHDYGPAPHRTLGEEKRQNPYLKCENLEQFKHELRNLQ